MTTSAGLLLFRERDGELEVLLGHMGGPFWARKDAGAWSIPKGELHEGEDPQAGALREFAEELGHAPPAGDPFELGEIRQKGGKQVRAWGAEADADPHALTCNTFQMEWPPRSGTMCDFPEVDRWEWFDLEAAARQINPAQVELLERLKAALD